MSDVGEFLSGYSQLLGQQVAAQMPPELLIFFDVECSLAQTDTKELYVVRHKGDGRRGILRVSKNNAHEDAGAEAAMLVRLNHADIPRVLGFWQVGQQGFLVREYFEGRTLNQVVTENGPLAARDVLDIAARLAKILVYLHGQTPPVVHRDIKPQNIVLATDGSLKLIDFGIARSYQHDGRHDTVYLGSRPYAPPEQFGYAQTSPQSDIYAMGVVLLYLATGSTDRQNLESRIENRRLRALVERCIAFDPAARFESAQQVLDYLRKSGQRRGLWAGALAGAVAVVVLASVVGYTLGRGSAVPAAGSLPAGSAPSAGQAGVQSGSTPQSTGAPQSGAAYTPLPIPGNLPFEGNWNGNIANDGMAVGTEEAIYFSDGNAIYAMAGDDEPVLLAAVAGAEYLNLYDGVLYYSNGSSICCINVGAGETEPQKLANASAGSLVARDGVLYYKDQTDGNALYQVSLDGRTTQRINDLRNTIYLNIYGGRVYYADDENGYALTSANVDGSDVQVLGGEAHWVCVYEGTIYCNIDGGLQAIPAEGGEAVMLASASVAYINVTPYGIFYKDHSDKGYLKMMPLGGGSAITIAESYTKDLSVAGGWVFYWNDDDGGRMWRVRIDGTENQPAATG